MTTQVKCLSLLENLGQGRGRGEMSAAVVGEAAAEGVVEEEGSGLTLYLHSTPQWLLHQAPSTLHLCTTPHPEGVW
jgi:hypothetical protein